MASFNLDTAINKLELGQQLEKHTSPIPVSPMPGTNSASPKYSSNFERLISPIAEADIQETGDSGSKYDFGYINQLNLEDYRANNQSAGARLAEGGVRTLGGAILKFGEGVTTLGSAIGVGVENLIADTVNPFEDKDHQLEKPSLDSITDNPINNFMYSLEDTMKKDLPIYKNQNFDDKNLLQQMGTTAWWADEGADVLGFALSNLIPAGAIGKLGLGAKAAGLLGADLTLATDAAGDLKTAGGLFAKVSAIGDNIGKMGKMGELANDVLIGKSGLGNPVQFSKNIDNLAQNAYMTTSEAYFMSRDAGTAVTNNYLQQHGLKSVDELNPDQQKELSAKKAEAEKYTFWSNMAALTFVSKFEAGVVNKVFGKAGESSLKGLINVGESLTDSAAPVEREGVMKFLTQTKAGGFLKGVSEGLGMGIFKADIQNSINQVATQFGYRGKLDYINQVLNQATNNLGDADAYKQMGANIVVEGLTGGIGGFKEVGIEHKAVQRAVDLINSSKENMVNLDNVLYERNSDGTTKVDSNGKPVYNVQAITDYVANTQQVQDLAELHDVFKNGGENNIAKILKNEAFAKYAVAHLEAGLGDELTAKVKSLAKYSDDDLAKLGYDPIELDDKGDKVSVATKAQALLDLSNQIKKDYQRVTKTVQNVPENNARINEAVKILTRTRTLDDIQKSLVRDNMDNLATLSEQNELVARFNDKAEQLQAAKLSLVQGIDNGNVSEEQRANLLSQLDQREKQLIEEKKGIAEQLHQLGYRTSLEGNQYLVDASPIKSELQDSPEYQSLVNNHKDIEDTKIAKQGQLNYYNRITDFKNGAANFQAGIVASKMADLIRQKGNQEVEDEAAKQLAQYQEGDYIRNGNGDVAQLSKDEWGNLHANGTPFDTEFIKNNPDVHKLTPEEAEQHLGKLEQQRRINEVQDKLQELNQQKQSKEGNFLDSNLKIENVLNEESGKVRLSEQDLSKQIADIKEALPKLQDNQGESQKLSQALSLLEGLQQKSFPNQSDIPSTETKEVELNKRQVKEVKQALATLNEVKANFEQSKLDLDNKIKDLELEHNKLVQGGPIISEHSNIDNPPSTGGDIAAEDIKPTINNIQKTAGSHFPKGEINQSRGQRAWFKYTEEYDPKIHKGHRLRAVTINDPEYGINGSKGNLYFDDIKEHLHEGNIKVLAVDEKGKPIFKDGLVYTSLVEITPEMKELEHFKWSNGENMFRGLSSKELERQAIEDYRSLIKQIKNSKEPIFLQINTKSNGIQIKGEPISAEEAFGKQKTYDLRVAINKQTTVGGNDYGLHQGLVYAVHRSRPIGAQLRTLTTKEVEQVLQKLKDYASKRGTAEGVNTLNQLKSILYLGERGLKADNSIFFIKGRDALSFGNSIISHEDLLSSKYDQQLKDFLTNQNHQVDRKLLEENKPFTDIFDKKWKSYQDYLLSNRGEETPLRFTIPPLSNDINKPQFKNTYLTYTNPKLETKEVTPQETTSTKQVEQEVSPIPFRKLSDLTNDDRITSNSNPTREKEIIESVNKQGTDGKTGTDISTGETNKSGTSEQEQVESQAQQLLNDINGDDLFNLNKEQVKSYQKIEPEKAEQWFKENISTKIPYERVKSLIDGGNYGRFEKAGRVLVSDLATEGTQYHEGFHVVTQLYLNEDERNQLYKNWREENPSEKLTDREVEERLAEEFREFMLTDYSSSKNKSFFQKIADFIRNLVGLGKSDKEQLFQNIGDGKYLDYKSFDTKSNDVLYSVADAFSASTSKDLFDSMTLALFQAMQKNNFTIKDLESYASGKMSDEDSKRFVGLYNLVNQTMIKGLENAIDLQSNNEFLEKEVIPFVKSNGGQLALEHLKYLGLVRDGKAKVDYVESLNIPETDKENALPESERSKDTLGIIEAIEFSPKDGMPNTIKLMIAGLPKTGIDKDGNYYVVKNNLGLPTVSDFKRNINILTNELAGYSNLRDQVARINLLRTKFPEFKRLLEQLGVTPDGKLSPTATPAQFELQSKFRQQFDKNYYTFYIQLHEGDNNYLIDANTDKLTNIIKDRWQGASIENKSAVKSVGGQYVLDKDYFAKKYSNEQLKGDEKKKSVLSFYKDLGITFSRPDLVDIDVLADKQKALLSKIADEPSNVSDIFEGNTGWINSVIEQEVANSFDATDNQHINPEGKTVYNVSLNDYLSQIVNEINNYGLPAHLQWDEESQTGNPALRNSVWKGLIEDGNQIKAAILEGSRINEQGETGESTRNLSTPDIMSQQFTAIMDGKYPFMRASDKSLEKGFTFGNKSEYVPLEEATTRFSKYLADEMLSSWMLNVEGIGKEFTEYAKSAKDLRIFKDILNSVDEKTKNSLLERETSRQEAIKLIDNFIESDSVRKSIQDWLENHVQDNMNLLEENGLVIKAGDKYSLLGIASEISERVLGTKNALSKQQFHELVEQYTIHHLTSNIEQTKLFTGDLAHYKDFFKRTSGLVGTGKTAWTGEEVDEWLNNNRPRNYIDRDGNLQIDKKSNGKIKSWVFNDVATTSSNKEEYINRLVEQGLSKDYANQLLKGYDKYDEADAQAYMTLPEYREFLSRIGDWTGSHEAIFDKLTNNQRLSKNELDWLFGYNALKPQYFGPQEANELNAPTFYKTSIIPLIPSVVEGTHLEELMHTMHENGTGLSIFKSGSKVANKEANTLYNEEGKIKLDPEQLQEQNLDYKYMKIQLDISPYSKDKVVFGTQFRKLVLSNLANKEISVLSKDGSKLNKVKGSKLIDEYSNLINKVIKNETENLVNKLGLSKVDDNTYKLANPQFLRDLLVDEAFKRNAPDNILNGIKQVLTDNPQPFDVLVNRNKIENILMSLVDNNVINQQVFGDAKVQVASTGFEPNTSSRTLADAQKQTWWSKIESPTGEVTNLQFYGKNEDGTTKGMEVLLPHYFKEYWGRNVDVNKIDSRLLDIVGFRIPTQTMATTELIRVKGFLPPEAGNIVIVPSEIVTKAGSDFDIDKLNLMFPNYERTEDGLRYIEYNKDTENDTKALQNRIQEIAKKLIAAPENFQNLITPTSSDIVKNIATEISSLKTREDNPLDNGKGYNISWRKNLETREQFLDGKDGIAQVAQHNVHHVLGQIAKLKSKPNVQINLPHNEIDNQIDFSQEKSVDTKGNINSPTILETISAFLNSFVDAAKDPFLSDINANTKTIGTWLYLVRAGVPLKQLALFMNQPIITEYLKAIDRNGSQFLKSTNQQLFQSQVEDKIREKYGKTKLNLNDTTDFSFYKDGLLEKELAKNIKDPSKAAGSIQQQILTDFLNYQDAGQELSDLISVTRPDTRGPGATLNSAQDVLDKLEEVKKNSIFDTDSIDKIFSNTFVGGFQDAIAESIKMYNPLFFTENGFAKEQLGKIKNVLNNNKFADREKALNLVKNDLINYTLQKIRSNGQNLGQLANELYVGENSLPKLLSKVKDNPVLRDNLLIKELTPIISKNSQNYAATPEGIDRIKTFNKRLTAADSNLVTQAFKELFRQEPELANKIMQYGILQSGLNNSPVSYMQYIPNEEYIPLATELLGKMKENPDFSDFESKFYKNNYRNDDLVPRLSAKGFENGYGNTILVKSPRLNDRTGKFSSKDNRKYSYVKLGSSKNPSLYENTGRLDEKGRAIFTLTNKLGDGYDLREWSDRSIIASNNLDGKPVVEKTMESDSKYDMMRAKLYEMLKEATDDFNSHDTIFGDKVGTTVNELREAIDKANTDEEFADLLKTLCGER